VAEHEARTDEAARQAVDATTATLCLQALRPITNPY
jgi:hypothetical protein